MNFNKPSKQTEHGSKIQDIISQVHQTNVKQKGSTNKRGSVFDLGGPKGRKQEDKEGQSAGQDTAVVSQENQLYGQQQTGGSEMSQGNYPNSSECGQATGENIQTGQGATQDTSAMPQGNQMYGQQQTGNYQGGSEMPQGYYQNSNQYGQSTSGEAQVTSAVPQVSSVVPQGNQVYGQHQTGNYQGGIEMQQGYYQYGSQYGQSTPGAGVVSQGNPVYGQQQTGNYQGGSAMPQGHYQNSNHNQYGQSTGADLQTYQSSTQSYKIAPEGEMLYSNQQDVHPASRVPDDSNRMQMPQHGDMKYSEEQQKGSYQNENPYSNPRMGQMDKQGDMQYGNQQGAYDIGNVEQQEGGLPQGNFPGGPNTIQSYQQSNTSGEGSMSVAVPKQQNIEESNTTVSAKKPKGGKSSNVMSTQDTDNDRTYCEVCDVKFEKESVRIICHQIHQCDNCHDSKQYWIHCRGLAHYQKVEELERQAKAQSEPSTSDAVPSWQYCEACDMNFYSEGVYMVHLKANKHMVNAEILEREKKKQQVVEITEQSVKNDKWVPATEKNLTPYDIGKVDQLFCEVCNISCTGIKCFEMHLAGSRHLKKVKRAQLLAGLKEGQELNRGPMIQKRDKAQSSIQAVFDSCREPLLGADYVTEYRKKDANIDPSFACALCECRMFPEQVIVHLTGSKHRIKYMKYHHPSNYNLLWSMKKSDKTMISEKMAAGIEQKEGRYNMRLRVEVDPVSEDNNGTWEDVPREKVRSGLPGDKTERNLQGFAEEKPGEQNNVDEGEGGGDEETGQKSSGQVPTLFALDPRPSRPFEDMDWSKGALTAEDKASSSIAGRGGKKEGKYYDQWMKYFKELDREKERLAKEEELDFHRQDPYLRKGAGGRGKVFGSSPYGGDIGSFKKGKRAGPRGEVFGSSPYGSDIGSFNKKRAGPRGEVFGSSPYSGDIGSFKKTKRTGPKGEVFGSSPYGSDIGSFNKAKRTGPKGEVFGSSPYGNDIGSFNKAKRTGPKGEVFGSSPYGSDIGSFNKAKRTGPKGEVFGSSPYGSDIGSFNKKRAGLRGEVFGASPYGTDTGSFENEERGPVYESPYESLLEKSQERERLFGITAHRENRPAAKSEGKQALENILDEIKKRRDSGQLKAGQAGDEQSTKVEKLADIASQASALLQTMGDCLVVDENDAEVALQMSNALTQSLLNYRLKSLPEDQKSVEVKDKLQMLSEAAKELTGPGSAFSQKPPPPPHKLVQEDPPPPPHKQVQEGDRYQASGKSRQPDLVAEYTRKQVEYRAAQSHRSKWKGEGYMPRKQVVTTGQSSSMLKVQGKYPIIQMDITGQSEYRSGQNNTFNVQGQGDREPLITAVQQPSSKEAESRSGQSYSSKVKGEVEYSGKPVDTEGEPSNISKPSPQTDIRQMKASPKETTTAVKIVRSLPKESSTEKVKPSLAYPSAKMTAKNVVAATMAARREIRKQENVKASSSPSTGSSKALNSSKLSSKSSKDNTPSNFKAYMSQLKLKSCGGSGGSDNKPKYSVTWPSGNKSGGSQGSSPVANSGRTENPGKRSIAGQPTGGIPATKKSCSGNSPIF